MTRRVLIGDTDRAGLSLDPFKALVGPRPIGWIGTRSEGGANNLAPYSFFNVVSDEPRIVFFSSSEPKDSLANAEATGVFTVNFVTRDLADAMNLTSARLPHGVDEFANAGLAVEDAVTIDAPLVAVAAAALECRVTEIIRPRDLDGRPVLATMVLGQVLAIHVSESIIKDGRIDPEAYRPLGRLGYRYYVESSDIFQLTRPPGAD